MNYIKYALLLLPIAAFSQTSGKNYVKTTIYNVPYTSIPDGADKNVQVSYFDGLGRPQQSVASKAGGGGEDIITHMEYDAFGRQTREYLPFAQISGSNVAPYIQDPISRLTTFYNTPKYENTDNYYSEKYFERSPLGRVLEQGAPGRSWELPEKLNIAPAILYTSFFEGNCYFSYPFVIDSPVISLEIIDNHLVVKIMTSDMGRYQWEISDNPGCVINTEPISIAAASNYTFSMILPDADLGMLRDNSGQATGYKVIIQNGNLIFKPEVSGVKPTVKSINATLSFDLTTYLNQDSHTLKFDYAANRPNEVLHFDVGYVDGDVEDTVLTTSGYYGISQLYKTITKNENWKNTDGLNNTSEDFTDKQGRIVLKRIYNEGKKHDTYYVYDKFSNLSYVIPPLATDAIVQTTTSFTPLQHNFAWTKLSLVDSYISNRFDALAAGVDNSEILNISSYDICGGQGGFSVIPDENNNLALNINIVTATPKPYRTGFIADISHIGSYPDKELGRISGDGYEYIFSLSGNMIMVDGYGDVPSINTGLAGNHQLDYNRNYPWTRLCTTDSRVAEDYDNAISGLDNSEILTTYVFNDNDAHGGLSVSLDEFDTLTLSLNITSGVPMKLVTGVAFALDIERSIPDRVLGTISGSGYSYEFSIVNNSLFIDGTGFITKLSGFFSKYASYSHAIDQQAVKNMCYIYHYDKRNRMTEKHIPDNGWTHIVYDGLDRAIMTQDENHRLNGEWIFTKYDSFDRVIMTGKYTDAANKERSVVQVDVDSNSNYLLSETRYAFPTLGLPGGFYLFYSTDHSFPPTGEIYTIQYYDEYVDQDKNSLHYLELPSEVFGQETGSAKGLLTTSHTKVLNGGNYYWETKTPAYDGKGRMIWQKTYNSYLGSTNTNETELDFVSRAVRTRNKHEKYGQTLVVEDFFEYDSAGRVLKQSQGINGSPLEIVVFNRYDVLGQLDQKKTGASDSTYITASALQTVDYTYNIRGWLKAINDPHRLGSDFFAFGITYDEAGLYNGNIGQTTWRSALNNAVKRYDYQYDALNRLTASSFYENGSSKSYNENGITYDKNGNILQLTRSGLLANNTLGITDDLAYIYKPFSNQLLKVNDHSGKAEGFNDQHSGQVNDFEYDASGNMQQDLNKQIGETPSEFITYNHLNLPVEIIQDSYHKIRYVYDASGKKVEKIVTNGSGNITTTQYANGFVYENNILQYFMHPEGYVHNSNGSFSYVYQYKDHLGNIRLSYSDTDKDGQVSAADITEETNYYPFGMQHGNNLQTSGGNHVAQKIKYNGKELQDELGLGIYDYGARNYDPAIGRWFNIDPKAEVNRRWSPYRYAYNNPLTFIDPDGMLEDWFKDGDTYRWDDRVTDQATATKFHGEDANYVGKAGTVTTTQGDKILDSVHLNSDGTVTKDNVTLGQNSIEQFSNQAGSFFEPRQTGGNYVGLTVGFAFFGGAGFSLGHVSDATGGGSFYFSGNANIGYGADISLDIGQTKPTGDNQFAIDDFAGEGATFSAGISTPLGSPSWTTGGSVDPNWSSNKKLTPNAWGTNERGYKIEQSGFGTFGLGAGATLSLSTTTLLK